MWKGYYGKEPFDLRLTALRFLENLGKIIALTLVGTLLFGGGYYVKNVLLGAERQYSVTSTFKVDYVTPPVNSGDYFINEVTWNTLVQTAEFQRAVQTHLANITIFGEDGTPKEMLALGAEEIAAAISAKLPSDWNIPTVTVVTDDPVKTIRIALAVEAAMVDEFADYMEEIDFVRVLSPAAEAEEVEPDVRPARAFILSALLSFFFVTVLFLLKEIGDDSIWLPATIRRRYHLPVLGTDESPELVENIVHLFENKKNIAVYAVDNEMVDAEEIVMALQENVKEERAAKNWKAVTQSAFTKQGMEALREADGILLAVRAGSHAGKPLEYVAEYLAQQDCEITAVLLWEADEWLIKAYYCFAR